jgi:hypothetical protein
MGFVKSFFVFVIKAALIVAVATALFLYGMKFADGPWGLVQGGPFSTGELVEEQTDWAFIKDKDTIEFQLLEPISSRTTWVMEHEGRIFIPSGYMLTDYGKIWKKWPLHAEKDGQAILRVDGKLFERTLVRVIDDPILPPVLAELSRKYAGGAPIPVEEVTRGSLWVFELVER